MDNRIWQPCPRCGGSGIEEIAENCSWGFRVSYQYDLCRECGGEGQIEVEPDDVELGDVELGDVELGDA